ncbi:MAG: hypothetical protein ACE5GM_05235 [bacterium]
MNIQSKKSLLLYTLLIGLSSCGPFRFKSSPEHDHEGLPSHGGKAGGGIVAAGYSRIKLDPETYRYDHFYRYRESPKQVLDMLADILRHYGYPDIKKDAFTLTLLTGLKPHDSLFVRMSKGVIRTRVAALAKRVKGKTVLGLCIRVEQKGADGRWRIIMMPSNQLDMIDSANYETYFHTIEGHLKPSVASTL